MMKNAPLMLFDFTIMLRLVVGALVRFASGAI